MDVSAVSPKAISAVRPDLLPLRIADARIRARATVHLPLPRTCRVGSDQTATRRPGKILTAISAAAKLPVVGGADITPAAANPRGAARAPRVFIGLPLDVVSDCNSINHAKAISAGLKALKLLGVDGVELPIWWGIVEKESMGKYDWTSYLSLTELIRNAGLHVRASLLFHGSNSPAIPLPAWVCKIGDANPDIYCTNKDGKRYKESLSPAVDDLPIFGNKTAVQVFEDFCLNFRDAFSGFMGSTITDISVGLGPGGELRYPSSPAAKSGKFVGVGEFQCFDKHMLNNLKEHAEKTGNPMWGLSGPHDAPRPDQTPDSDHFFKEHGGSWDTSYGKFFLAWYSEQLLSHGNRLLSSASAVFGSSPDVKISAKIPLMHSWYKTRSHASELTAGYYNTDHRDGYDAVAELFSKHNCTMTLTGMDLSDEHESQAARCSPESLLAQILEACKKHNVSISGENHSISGVPDGFSKIKKNILNAEPFMHSFTYQRMGAYFFSPEHWPRFTEFIRNIDRPELHTDDKVSSEKGFSLTADSLIGSEQRSRQMQAV